MGSISKKKIHYPINEQLSAYLLTHNRQVNLPVQYEDLRHFTNAIGLTDKNGRDTLWKTVFYAEWEVREIYPALKSIYALLKADGDETITQHLSVDRVDFCEFGNSQPFRVKIINNYNDNYDYFYVKKADASRVYGLELEHILSPNRIHYFVHDQTLIEEHIAGIPGDQFIQYNLSDPLLNEIRLAKEFVKFNERCFILLLGDMRSYNFVIDVTQDFDDIQYRIRAIDFDQQSYEDRIKLYMPQFFKENLPFVKLGIKHINAETVSQYQTEERALIVMRLKTARYRMKELIDVMAEDDIAPKQKIVSLRKQLAAHYKLDAFLECETMGSIVKLSLRNVMKKLAEQQYL